MGTALFANMDAKRILAFSLHGRQLYPRATQITPDATVRVGHGFCTSWTNRHVIIRESWTTLVYSTRFPWTPLWGRRGGPEEITPSPNWSGHLGEVMLNLFEEEENGGISQGRRWAPAVHDRLQEGADRP